MTTIHSIARKAVGREKASEHLHDLLAIFRIASVTPAVIRSALELNFSDFEDAILHESAAAISANAIVTRNPADFTAATIPVYEPPQIVSHLGL